ncbi:MAG: orotidine-5'-phosphate decarboxylase [Phycisphaerales bacterium]|nr:orotidine-5'-phosphate decarboxylase [Phycisphaerales bacterium]
MPEQNLKMNLNFADRLLAAIDEKKTPLIVGLDPVYENLPPAITGHRELNDDQDLEVAVDAILEYCTRLLKVVAPLVPAVKINSAFFEQYYWYGMEAFHALVQEAAAHGLIVINDAKRADIGNTSERYASATLADPGFASMDDTVGADAVTVNPYMGSDSLAPFIKTAKEFNKGLFVLVRTSNPGAAEIQDANLSDGNPVYQHVGKLVAKWGAEMIGVRGYSSIGAVVGATNPGQLAALRWLLPQTLFLVPGYGAQGGTAADIAKAFKADKTGAIINSSRAIIYAHKSSQYAGMDWQKAVELATLAAKTEIAQALGMS